MRFAAGLAVLAAAIGAPAAAHHGFGTYDLNADMRITGTLVAYDFVNPHSWLHIEAAGPDGQPVVYHCEMRAASVLRRSGWSRDMFTIGETITMDGAPDRRNPQGCYVGSVTYANGARTIDRYGQITALEEQTAEIPLRRPDGLPNFEGDWALEQSVMTDSRGLVGALLPLSVVQELEDGELPAGVNPFPGSRGADSSLRSFSTSRVPLTPRGQELADAYDDQSPADNPRLRCEVTSIIFDWTFDQPIHRIAQNPYVITIAYGDHGMVRTIYLNQAAHPADIAPSRAGHSIGRWEGDELVVDTVAFEPGLLGPPVHHGAQLHVVERFSRDPATGALRRSYVATDPEYFIGEYAGADAILPSAEPFNADPCREPDFREYSGD